MQSAAIQMLDMDDHPELWHPPDDLVDRQRFTTPPRHGLGRGFKVAKEEIVGLLVALELFAKGQYDERAGESNHRLETIARPLRAAGVACRVVTPQNSEAPPWLELELYDQDAFDVCRRLRTGEPPVFVGHGRLSDGILVVRLDTVRTDQDAALTSRLLAELGRSSID